MSFRAILILLGIVACLVFALVLLQFFFFRVPRNTTSTPVQQSALSEITLGEVRSAEELTKPNPALTQKREYKTSSKLALRVKTASIVTEPYTLSVRLLKRDGTFSQLDPDEITLQPGLSSYCCWTIDEVGKFSLQIFRPEGTITTLPLTIR